MQDVTQKEHGEGSSHCQNESQPVRAASLFSHLQEYQAVRSSILRAQIALQNQARSYVRRMIGWHADLPDMKRAAINKLAKEIVECIEKDKEPLPNLQNTVVMACPFVSVLHEARKPIDAERKAIEKAIVKRVKQLSVWPWWESIRGLDALGLAMVIGETGDLSNYSNPAKLWKRMGVSVGEDGKAPKRTRNKAKAIAMGYSPRRRSVIWNVGDPLIKLNKGVYRAAYDDYKALQLAKEEGRPGEKMTKGWAHNRAHRFMEKLLLKDLWIHWNNGQVDTIRSL